jgi:signal transduction histidine kinase
MLDAILNTLASLRLRLIVTYMLVTVISFGLLILLLHRSTDEFLMRREESNLRGMAITLGTTVRSGVDSSEATFLLDQKWTQRRCHDYLNRSFPELRFRMLDTRGHELMDSFYGGDWASWLHERKHRPGHGAAPEVRDAIAGATGAERRYDGERTGRPYSIFIAHPILRTDPNTHQRRVAFIMYLDKPADEVHANLRELSRRMSVGMLASLLLTVLVSILFSSNLSAGLRNAAQVARAFAAGRMDGRMRESGRDEVGQLGKAFNQMADNLERQEQLRRNLLADVSHELRTPLTAIAGCADTLTDGTLTEDPAAAQRFLDIIVRESERLQRLVNDILDLSKLQAGALPIPLAPLALRPLLEDAVEIARMQAEADDIAIQCECETANALVVMGNEDRLAQALRNLLDNARHHSPARGTIAVSVEARRDWVLVHIRDEGEGIPPEDLPWVFDRFYRAGRGVSKPGGTGLGLAIVREILLAHQGRVSVMSTVGAGTTFSLHLPRVQAEDVTDAEA